MEKETGKRRRHLMVGRKQLMLGRKYEPPFGGRLGRVSGGRVQVLSMR